MQTKIRFISMLVIALACSLCNARADADADTSFHQTLSPYFSVDTTADDLEPFVLEATDVHAIVNGVIADVTVTQTYRNGGTRPIHARYVFPASTRAAVHGLTIQVGQQRVVAQIKERMQAKQEFERAAASGKTASLLEQQRPNVFTMSVSNILPGDHVSVVLSYSELLVPTDGVYQFVYPTVVGPRYAGAGGNPEGRVATVHMHEGDAPDSAFSLQAEVSTGVPLYELKSPTHAVEVTRTAPSLARVRLSRARADGYAANRDFVLEYRLRGVQIESGLLLYQGPTENQFLLLVQPPVRVEPAVIAQREYVFVLDVSGSMFGFPLDTAKRLISDLISQLRPSDSFNVLLFSGDSRLWHAQSQPASARNVASALAFIDAQNSGGGTELSAALQTVAALPRSEHVSRSVVVLTDGYIAQERAAFELISKHLRDTNVFAFGIGSSVNRYLIEGIARAGQGEPFVVTEPSEAQAVAQRFRRYIEAPVLTEVSVRFSGFDAYDVEPTAQPDLFAQRPIVVLGKWRGAPQGEITVVGRTSAGPFEKRVKVTPSSARPEHAALPQLWARSRIARLEDWNAESSDSAVERQVTALGLQYSLLTPYTSFIAVLEQVRTSEPATLVDQPLALPLGVSEIGAGEYEVGAEPPLSWLVMLGALGVCVSTWARRRRAGALDV